MRPIRPDYDVTGANVEAYFTVHSGLLQLPSPHRSSSEAIAKLAKKLSSIDSNLDNVANIIAKPILNINDYGKHSF
jgi:hypothetical protein